MVGKTVLIEVHFVWIPEEPVRTLAGHRLGSECTCKLLKGVLVLSLEIGELQAARLENAIPLLIRIKGVTIYGVPDSLTALNAVTNLISLRSA